MAGARIGRPARPAAERFAEKYVVSPDGCWLWIGTLCSDGDGYGVFKVPGKLWRAHRWSYAHFVGAIPEGLTLDHLCRVRNCVNPEHLEPVSNAENVLRGIGPSARAARRTHCFYGHPLDGFRAGARYCKTCHRSRAAAYRVRRQREESLVG